MGKDMVAMGEHIHVILDLMKVTWKDIYRLDENLQHTDVQWYLQPGKEWLFGDHDWRTRDGFDAEIDPRFPQPSASTSTIRRVVLPDGKRKIIKEFSTRNPFYGGTAVARALTLAGEQALGRRLNNHGNKAGRDFYQGIYGYEQSTHKGRIHLQPYQLGDNLPVVSLMREVDVNLTLSLHFDLEENVLEKVYGDLVVRAMQVSVTMPKAIKQTYSSMTYIGKRINEHTPGEIFRGKVGASYPHLKKMAAEYIELANILLENDGALRDYLLKEIYARRSGDVRAVNVMLTKGGEVDVVVDPINLLLPPDGWGVSRVSPPPWGMNSALYEVGFLIPDLLAHDKMGVVEAVIRRYAEFDSDFAGLHWDNVAAVPMRALRFWVAMKCVEMAGLSTFNVSDPRLTGKERAYLENVIANYGGIGVAQLREMK